MAAVKSLPVHHHSAGYIFIFFWIIQPILVILKIEYRLSRRLVAYAASQTTVLHMKRLNKTESPISLMFLCEEVKYTNNSSSLVSFKQFEFRAVDGVKYTNNSS